METSQDSQTMTALDTTTHRYCPDGHKHQTQPEFVPCCPKARRPGSKERRRPRGTPLYRARLRAKVRSFIQLRDKGLCRYCGQRGQEVDHVVPRCNGGGDHAFDNLVWSCKKCNGTKGREEGFTLKKERLYWYGRLVAPGSIFGPELMAEIEAQRLERQVAAGLTGVVNYKQSM